MGLTDSHETATKNLTITRTNCQILTFIRKKKLNLKKNIYGSKSWNELLNISGNNSWNDVNRYS